MCDPFRDCPSCQSAAVNFACVVGQITTIIRASRLDERDVARDRHDT